MRDIEKEYKVADRHQDIRGWTLIGHSAAKIGRVEEFIVDTEAMKVRYLDVALYQDILNGESDRHLLLPVGVATLDYDHKAVLVPTLDPQLALKIPPLPRRNDFSGLRTDPAGGAFSRLCRWSRK